MSEPEFRFRIGRPPPELFVVHADGRCFARSAGGQMVEVALSRQDIERLQAGPKPGYDATTHVVRVLCEVLARELPRHRPS